MPTVTREDAVRARLRYLRRKLISLDRVRENDAHTQCKREITVLLSDIEECRVNLIQLEEARHDEDV